MKEDKRDMRRNGASADGIYNDLAILRVLPNASAFSFNTNIIYFFPFAEDYYRCARYGENRIKRYGGTKYFGFLYYTDSKIAPFDYPNHSKKSQMSYINYRYILRREQLVGSIGSCSKNL